MWIHVIFYHRTVHSNESRTSSAHVTFRTILVYCLCTIRYGLGRCFWGELYTHLSSDKGSSRQPWPLCCLTHPYSQPHPPSASAAATNAPNWSKMRMRYHLPCTCPTVYTPRLSSADALSSLWPPTLPQWLNDWPPSPTPPLMSRSHFSLLPPYHTVWPWPMLLGRALYPY